MSGEPPRVRLDCAATAGGLGRVLEVATGMLAEAGLIRLAGPDEPADVVHTVGEVAPWRVPGTAHWVHTVDRVVLRRRGLAVTAGWAHRQRRFAGGAGTWLVHGRMAAQVLVGAGVVDGDRVHGLPLVAPPGPPGKLDRSGVRDRLGIAPGVVLVAGADHGPGQSVPGWAETIGRLHRADVVVMRHEPGGSLAFGELLLAADLFVAPGLALTACNPGVAAVAAGVRVIAATTDSAAELVRFGRTGFVVPPHPAAIAAGVRAALDGVLPRGDPRPPRQRIEAQVHPLARGLLSGYHRALATRRAPAARSRS